MTGGRELLLLAAVIALLVPTEQKLTVSTTPNLTQVFSGDLLYLHCNDGQDGSTATWKVNGSQEKQNTQNTTLKIAAASSKDSGIYTCATNGQTSNDFDLKVLEYVPIASLSITTGQPVMRKNAKVLLELTNDDGLQGWGCKVIRGKNTRRVKLNLNNENPTSFTFETTSLKVPETIYWCQHETEGRSNQVVLRTTDNEVTLEMYPFPAIVGEKMTLRCLVWGTKEVTKSAFYKEDTNIKSGQGDTYDIAEVTESAVGRYKCKATYRYKDQTVDPHVYDSDFQNVPVHVSPVRAELSDTMGCSCPSCDKPIKSYMYYKQNGDSWTMLGQNKHPDGDGTYHCRAVLGNMRTLPSNAMTYNRSISGPVIGILFFIILLGLLIFAVAFYKWNKKRNARGDIYEQVPMRQGDPNYEAINMRQVKESEYDTLQPGAEGRQKTGGEYEALTKREGKDEVYHTLGENVASGGQDGGYEALKTAGIQKDEYETLKTKQPEAGTGAESGGDGGYQALKTAGIQKDEYETLKTKQPEGGTGAESGGDGGYQALKTAGIQKDEYETLKTKQPEVEKVEDK